MQTGVGMSVDKATPSSDGFRMPKEKGAEVEFTPEINPERDRYDGGRERDRGRGRSPRQEI